MTTCAVLDRELDVLLDGRGAGVVDQRVAPRRVERGDQVALHHPTRHRPGRLDHIAERPVRPPPADSADQVEIGRDHDRRRERSCRPCR
jgi:hypothetical protein